MRKLFAYAMQILSVAAVLLTAAPAALSQNIETSTFQTTEYHTIRGWEKQLVSSDRNLSKYYWTPITSISHGSGKTCRQVSTAAPVAQEQKQFHYIKPVQLPQACANHNLTPPAAAVANNVNATLSNTNCQARLANPSVSAKLIQPRAIAAKPATRTYANYNSPFEGQPVASNIESKEAYGRMVSR